MSSLTLKQVSHLLTKKGVMPSRELRQKMADAIDARLLSLDDELADYKNASLHAADDCTAKDAEIERLRESNRNLHRRCQEAESALPSYRKLIALPPNGDGVRFVSGAMGRALLVSMCNKLQAHGDAADALLREVYDHGENMALHEKIDAHLSENADVQP